MKISTPILQYHSKNRYFDIFVGNSEFDRKREHVEGVIRLSKIIMDSNNLNINKELLLICAEHHDDGRINQYEILGKFLDSTVSHNVLGLDRFDRFLQINSSHLPIDSSIAILRDCILYHGRPFLLGSENNSKPYVEIITAADDLENAARAVSYLVKQSETDEKNYRADYPNLDQASYREFVFEHFAKGEKFDRIVCKTYAEYVLFAATLVTNSLKKHEFAKQIMLEPGYGYSSILEGYRDVFFNILKPDSAEKAYTVLLNMLK